MGGVEGPARQRQGPGGRSVAFAPASARLPQAISRALDHPSWLRARVRRRTTSGSWPIAREVRMAGNMIKLPACPEPTGRLPAWGIDPHRRATVDADS